jgi:GntR family transcriptional repressor for pyruvate dehydrogenase complex
MKFTNIAVEPRRNAIMEAIQVKIDSGELEVGQKLPSERVLAEQLGASRTTIREAIRTMNSYGILETLHGSGTFVRSAFGFPRLEDDRVPTDSLFELRQIVEPPIAGLAAKRRTDAQLTRMHTVIKKHRQAIDDENGAAALEADLEFHQLVLEASDNLAAETYLRDLYSGMHMDREVSLGVPGQNLRAIETHLEILNSIERRDGAGAEQLMSEHLCQAQHFMESDQE